MVRAFLVDWCAVPRLRQGDEHTLVSVRDAAAGGITRFFLCPADASDFLSGAPVDQRGAGSISLFARLRLGSRALHASLCMYSVDYFAAVGCRAAAVCPQKQARAAGADSLRICRSNHDVYCDRGGRPCVLVPRKTAKTGNGKRRISEGAGRQRAPGAQNAASSSLSF